MPSQLSRRVAGPNARGNRTGERTAIDRRDIDTEVP
jgi:hypothetical protein